MNIILKEINECNVDECRKLKITKEQEKYLPHPNAESIDEWKSNPGWVALGIYADNQMIGFSMYGTDAEDGSMWLIRFMIDEKFQGKGYGKQALNEVLERMKAEKCHNKVWLSFHPESEIARRLYSNFGFKQQITGYEADDEVFYCLQV